MATITDLEAVRERLTRLPQPDDKFTITIDRVIKDYLRDELLKRKSRIAQALSDPQLKESKRTKYQRLMYGMTQALNQIQ